MKENVSGCFFLNTVYIGPRPIYIEWAKYNKIKLKRQKNKQTDIQIKQINKGTDYEATANLSGIKTKTSTEASAKTISLLRRSFARNKC